MDEVAALPITAGSVVPSARAVLRPPPTPTPARHPLPGSSPVIGHDAPTATSRRPPGRGGPPQFPPPPSERSEPHTPGGSSGLHFQALHPFHGLHPDDPGSAPPLSYPQAGRLD